MASSRTIMDLFHPAKRLKNLSSSSPSSSPQSPFLSPSASPKPSPPLPTAKSLSSSSSPNSTPLTKDQKSRLEHNQLQAKAKRNLRICIDRVKKTTSEDLGFVDLDQLLVEETWVEALRGEFEKPYVRNLSDFVRTEVSGGIPIYPPQHLIFNALNTTPFDRVKAVIIGQDPYHGPGQAMGLSFSVPQGIKVPSSLANMYKELEKDLGCSIPSHGNLEKWAVQGVLLLNAVLTVKQHQANSHAKRGWEQFTDAVIKAISVKRKGVVFLLWGNYAQAKLKLVDETKHHVLKAAHPSGLSANRGFFGCKHFSRTNGILEQMGIPPIDWQL